MTFFWVTWIDSTARGRKTLAEAGQKTAGQVRAYGLTRNCFHGVIETLRANLEKAATAMRRRQETTRTIKPM